MIPFDQSCNMSIDNALQTVDFNKELGKLQPEL